MTETLRGEAEIRNAKGLHARAAAKFCKTVERFDAVVHVARNGTEVTGTSIMGLMMLAAAKGSTVEISASGIQAQEAFDAVMKLIADKFDEE
jgi:phosphocarrier protein HPr